MSKTEITLAFESEKLEALEYYLRKENSTVQKKMDEALRQLYETTIPEPVREFVGRKASPPPRPKRPAPKPVVPKPAAVDHVPQDTEQGGTAAPAS